MKHYRGDRTIDGIARTVSLTYRDVTQFVSSSSDFSSKTYAFGLDYGYPITEYQGVRWGLSAQHSELLTTSVGSAQQAQQWVRNNGKTHTRQLIDYSVYANPIDRLVGIVTGDTAGVRPTKAGWRVIVPRRASSRVVQVT